MRSKADQERLEAIGNMPCICCSIIGVAQPSPTERHHLVDGGYREHSGGHQATLPLCGFHHRASCKFLSITKTELEMYRIYGPSLKYQGPPGMDNKGAFVKKWGTERELLERVNELLRIKI